MSASSRSTPPATATTSSPPGRPRTRCCAICPERPFADRAAFQPWLDKAAASEDPLFFAVVDKATGRAEGRLSLMRFDPAHGVIETGHLLFGPRLGQTRGATEAVYLLARHIFDALGYRRFEWKCNNANEPSKRAAGRFGFAFEGVFRQHMVIKGENRDTAWYSMLDGEWPARRRAFERWLEPSNFDDAGRQRLSLSALNAGTFENGDAALGLRLAGPGDLAALGELQRAAYAPNRDVLGVEPLPLLFDYGRALADHEVWLAETGARARRRADRRSRPRSSPDLEHRDRARGATHRSRQAPPRRRRGAGALARA
jgi:RimJ/RimL family protein N-acetyltransferase